jgi:hypothetical protein
MQPNSSAAAIRPDCFKRRSWTMANGPAVKVTAQPISVMMPKVPVTRSRGRTSRPNRIRNTIVATTERPASEPINLSKILIVAIVMLALLRRPNSSLSCIRLQQSSHLLRSLSHRRTLRVYPASASGGLGCVDAASSRWACRTASRAAYSSRDRLRKSQHMQHSE